MPRAQRSPLAAMAVAATLTAMLVPCVARGDDAKAQAARSFQTGSEAYQRKDFRAAARAFDDAYRIAPRGAAAYNAGLAWEGAGERTRAADDYTRALEASDLGPAERADATGRLRALDRTLARLSLTSPDGTRLVLDDLELPGSSPSIHVEPGTHALRVEYPGGRGESRSVVCRAGVEQSLRLGTPSADDAPPPPVEAPPEATVHARPSTEPPTHHETPPPAASPDRTPAWIALGGAVVAAGAAIGLYEAGLTVRNEFVNGGQTDSSQRNEATTLRTATWVAWSAAGVLAATGVVFYLTSSSSSPTTTSRTASPSVALEGRGVALRLPF